MLFLQFTNLCTGLISSTNLQAIFGSCKRDTMSAIMLRSPRTWAAVSLKLYLQDNQKSSRKQVIKGWDLDEPLLMACTVELLSLSTRI